MKDKYYKFLKWFNLHIAWIFVNGFKREEWNDYLKQKYGQDI